MKMIVCKYKYTGYGIEFDSRSQFLFTGGSYGKNVIIFGADMSSSVHVDNKGKDILILGEGKYHIHFTQSGKRFVSKVYTIMEAIVSYLLMIQKCLNSKQNNSEIKGHAMYLCNISKDFTINNMTKTGLKEVVKFSVDFNPIDTNDILDVHNYLMKRIT